MVLTREQLNDYSTQGFLLLEKILSDKDLEPVVQEISNEIEKRCNAFLRTGHITNTHAHDPFEQRYASLYYQCPEISYGMEVHELLGEGMFNLFRNNKILDVIETLLGPDVTLNPTHHLRGKLPLELVCAKGHPDHDTVPWHQDSFTTGIHPFDMITVWVPLVDATVENGCIEVLPGAFRNGRLPHRAQNGMAIAEADLPKVKPVLLPCSRGSVVLLHEFTPHRSRPNLSRCVRWSIDFRLQKTGSPSGRPGFPEFIVRSGSEKKRVITNYQEWRETWRQTLRSEPRGRSPFSAEPRQNE